MKKLKEFGPWVLMVCMIFLAVLIPFLDGMFGIVAGTVLCVYLLAVSVGYYIRRPRYYLVAFSCGGNHANMAVLRHGDLDIRALERSVSVKCGCNMIAMSLSRITRKEYLIILGYADDKGSEV